MIPPTNASLDPDSTPVHGTSDQHKDRRPKPMGPHKSHKDFKNVLTSNYTQSSHPAIKKATPKLRSILDSSHYVAENDDDEEDEELDLKKASATSQPQTSLKPQTQKESGKLQPQPQVSKLPQPILQSPAQLKAQAQLQAQAQAQSPAQLQAQAQAQSPDQLKEQAQALLPGQLKEQAQVQLQAEAQGQALLPGQLKAQAQAKSEAQPSTQSLVKSQAQLRTPAQAKSDAHSIARQQVKMAAQTQTSDELQAEYEMEALQLQQAQLQPGQVQVGAQINAQIQALGSSTNQTAQMPTPSVFDLSNAAARTNAQNASQNVGAVKSEKQQKFATKAQFTREQPDQSSIPPSHLGASAQAAANVQATTVQPIGAAQINTPPPPAPARTDLQALVNKLVQSMQVIETSGQTTTTISLKNMGVFEGAQVTLTSFASAPGQFNIAFTSLSPQAKQLIDMQTSQFSVKTALEQQGYGVHIVIATTLDLENLNDLQTGASAQQGYREGSEQDETADSQGEFT